MLELHRMKNEVREMKKEKDVLKEELERMLAEARKGRYFILGLAVRC